MSNDVPPSINISPQVKIGNVLLLVLHQVPWVTYRGITRKTLTVTWEYSVLLGLLSVLDPPEPISRLNHYLVTNSADLIAYVN